MAHRFTCGEKKNLVKHRIVSKYYETDCGLRKKHNTQHSLLNILENFKEALDKYNSVSAFFMDLSKAFNTLNHDLIN